MGPVFEMLPEEEILIPIASFRSYTKWLPNDSKKGLRNRDSLLKPGNLESIGIDNP